MTQRQYKDSPWLANDAWRMPEIGFIFPSVGIGLLVWAVRRTLEWKRFGNAPVVLDPFPGSIGGNIGGTIELGYPHESSAQFNVTLASIYSYVSGRGKNRKTREDFTGSTQRLPISSPVRRVRALFSGLMYPKACILRTQRVRAMHFTCGA